MHTKKNLCALENVCLRTKFDLRLEKNVGQFQNYIEKFLRRHQKMLVIQFFYPGIV